MENSSPKTVKSERQRRKDGADRCARWRARHADRPDTRITDRAILEALILTIADRELPADVVQRIVTKTANRAGLGLERQGYPVDRAKQAIGDRLLYLRNSRASGVVKAAMADREAGLPVVRRIRPVASENVPTPVHTPVTPTFADTSHLD